MSISRIKKTGNVWNAKRFMNSKRKTGGDGGSKQAMFETALLQKRGTGGEVRRV